jgi:gamma-glutamylcysteine synthetase
VSWLICASDQIFFTFLRGGIPPCKEKEIPDLEKQLRTATINIIVSVVEDDGYFEQTLNSTVPFAPIALANNAHLSIRNEEGTYVQHLVPGYNEVLTDYWIPFRWLATGTWTWKIVARLGSGDCLFAFTLIQRLEGAW